jgi:hypothetical protein
MWPCCIVTNFLIIKQTRCTNFSNLFWNETLHVLDSCRVHHQELFTVHSAMVYVIRTAFEQQDHDRTHSILILLLLESCLQTCMTYTIAECTVNNSWWWTEELSKTCGVSLQNKFEKLVYPVGFIIKKSQTHSTALHTITVTHLRRDFPAFIKTVLPLSHSQDPASAQPH